MGAGRDMDWTSYGKSAKTTLLNWGNSKDMDALLPGSAKKRRGGPLPQLAMLVGGVCLFLLLLVWAFSGSSAEVAPNGFGGTTTAPMKHMHARREAQIKRAEAETKRRQAMHNAAAKADSPTGGLKGYSKEKAAEISKNARDQAAAYNKAFQKQHERMQQQATATLKKGWGGKAPPVKPNAPGAWGGKAPKPAKPVPGLAQQMRAERADVKEKAARQAAMQKVRAAEQAARRAGVGAAPAPPAPPAIPGAPPAFPR